MNGHCPIWGSGFPAETHRSARDYYTRVTDSPRAGGSYKIEDTVKLTLSMDDQEKARLTTWIVNQNAQGAWLPEITHQIVEDAKRKSVLPVNERAMRLLQFIVRECGTVGATFETRAENLGAYAWSESTSESEVAYFIDFLLTKGWLDAPQDIHYRLVDRYRVPAMVIVSVEGHSQIAAKQVNVETSQGFVAMWFDDSMTEAFDKGIEPAIKDAGYKPLRIDQKEHSNKIDDEIVAEIRKSRFVVADFTFGEDGARGGVYYEAGLAHGRGIPVIYTCRKDQLDSVHFDTRQYNHIVWETPEELRDGLANRIRAVLGQGPEPLPSP